LHSENLAAQFFRAWKQLPDWWDEYWGVDWNAVLKQEMPVRNAFPDGEWTHGVITPFIITSVAPRLGCKPVRLEISVDNEDKRGRADYFLVKQRETHIYVEHENHPQQVKGELPKLRATRASLKVVVTYCPEKEAEDLANYSYSSNLSCGF